MTTPNSTEQMTTVSHNPDGLTPEQVAIAVAAVRESERDGYKQRLAELTRKEEASDDFMAFMLAELEKFPCCCQTRNHHSTPPMMWPELIACIARKAKEDTIIERDAARAQVAALTKERDALLLNGYDTTAYAHNAKIDAQRIAELERQITGLKDSYECACQTEQLHIARIAALERELAEVKTDESAEKA